MEKSYFEAAPLRLNGAENAYTRRYYKLVLNWMPYALKNFHEWDVRPNAGYFFTGCDWYGADQSDMSFTTAVISSMGEYDETVTGISREELKAIAIKTLRYACFTHDTGPSDCVRVDGRNRRQANTKWGGRAVAADPTNKKVYQRGAYFQGTQVGAALVMFGLAAWLLWKELDEETRQMCYNAITDYAERWVDVFPRDGTYLDTQAEENSWTACGISVAAHMFPDDPRAAEWKKAAVEWMLAGGSRTIDRWDNMPLSDGTRLNERLSNITFHPDFTAENHGIVHPDYMLAPLMFRVRIQLLTLLAGGEEYPGLRRNWKEIYDTTLKPWAAEDGGAVPVQSQDWWYYKTSYSLTAHAATNLLFRDREAAYLEQIALTCAEAIQAGNETRCFLENEPEKCIISSDFQNTSNMENSMAGHFVTAYLYHYLLGEGEAALSRSEFESKVDGVRYFPFGGTVLKRAEDSFSCFSWRNSALAVVLPNDLLWTITTPPASTFGTVKFAEPTFNNRLANEAVICETKDELIMRGTDSYAASARIERGFGALVQDAAFCALPSGDAVYFERVKAMQDCTLTSFESGLVGVRNEHYPLLPQYAKGYRDITVGDAAPLRMKGYYGGDHDDIFEFEPAEYAAIDDKMAYLTRGSYGMTYVNHHYYPKWKGVEDFFILNNHKDKLTLRAGEELAPFITVFLPNQSIEDAKRKNTAFITAESSNAEVRAVVLENTLIYSSIGYESIAAELSFVPKDGVIPVYEGSASLCCGKLSQSVRIPQRECGFMEAKKLLTVQNAAETKLFLSLAPTGELVVINRGGDAVRFAVNGKEYCLAAECSVSID